jgi:hypothetical protein
MRCVSSEQNRPFDVLSTYAVLSGVCPGTLTAKPVPSKNVHDVADADAFVFIVQLKWPFLQVRLE